jgi:LacI family transcriptional regulator
MPVTRDDVARRAGVSVATVSYVMNNGPKPVAAATRRRVVAAIEALGYRPNAIARSLRTRRTRILGLVLPDSANPYFAKLARAVEDAATARGYQVVVSNAAEDLTREARVIEALLRLQVDGLVWIPADLRAVRHDVTLPPVPTVQLDRALSMSIETPLCDVVGSDNVAGGELAATHLLDLGHRRIAVLSGPRGHAHADDRLQGACASLEKADVQLPGSHIAYGDFSYAAGAMHAQTWLSLPAGERPSAVICANDAMAIGVLSAAAGWGVRVPEDLSVVGYDDVPQATFTVPPLTTVAQPLEEMAIQAVNRLLFRVERPDNATTPEYRVLPVRLILRRSTAPLKMIGVHG